MVGPLHRSWLWRRLDEPEAIAAVLRSALYRDRAPLENALSRYFFAPFRHQEVAEGEAFERRARVSRQALAVDEPTVTAVADEVIATLTPGPVADLLDEVRRSVVAAMCRLTFGDDALEGLVLAAVRDFDDAIKMRGRVHPDRRQALAEALAARLGEPSRWPEGTLLGQARAAWAELGLDDRVDQVATVLLGTGSIQITDVVTHSLIALAQHPRARRFDDEAVVQETIRRYPVNASLTRRPRGETWRGGVSVVPAEVNRRGWTRPDDFDPGRFAREEGCCFGFGHGPRACPARRFALALSARLLRGYRALGVGVEPGYRHRRSLAIGVAANLGGPPPAPAGTRQQARRYARYVGRCATTYPRAFWQEILRPALGAQARQGPEACQGKVPPHSVPHCPKTQLIDCNAKSAADKSPLKQFNTQMRSG